METLHAIGSGINVYGCSSMGALRAAELWPQGMIGMGLIFELYRGGLCWRDDEVAILHHPSDFHTFTVPLVNIRVLLMRLRAWGWPHWRAADQACDELAECWFGDRTIGRVLDTFANHIGAGPTEILEHLITDEDWDQKRRDAISTIAYVHAISNIECRVDARGLAREASEGHHFLRLLQGHLDLPNPTSAVDQQPTRRNDI